MQVVRLVVNFVDEAVVGDMEESAVIRGVQSDVNLYCSFIIFIIAVRCGLGTCFVNSWLILRCPSRPTCKGGAATFACVKRVTTCLSKSCCCKFEARRQRIGRLADES